MTSLTQSKIGRGTAAFLFFLFLCSSSSWATVPIRDPLRPRPIPKCICINATGQLVTELWGNVTVNGESLGGVTAIVCWYPGDPNNPTIDFYNLSGDWIFQPNLQYDGTNVVVGLVGLPGGGVQIDFLNDQGQWVDGITIAGGSFGWFASNQCPPEQYTRASAMGKRSASYLQTKELSAAPPADSPIIAG